MTGSTIWAGIGIGLGLALAWWPGSTCDARGAEDAAGKDPQVLYLQTEFLPYVTNVDQALPYRLGREIVRQAILLAARDELGLTTRDETLQESIPQQGQVTRVMPIERAYLTGKWDVKLIPQPKGSAVWEKSYDFVAHGGKIYGDILPKLELDTRGALLEGLRAAGLEGTKPAARNPSPPGAEIEKMLGNVDCVVQFGAVRAAHDAIAAQGETPEWLGVLVRGYANLALLTGHYWNSTPEVYTARAWLYAQRLVAASESSDWALWHRAYAWAWGGAQQHAWADLVELERRQQKAAEPAEGDGAPPAPPAWSKLIKPYCTGDRAALKQLGAEDSACRTWATLLRFNLGSFNRQPRWMWDVAEEITQVCPAAYCAYSDLAHYGGYLALTRSGAAWAPEMFSQHVPRDVAELPGLPASIEQLVAGQKPKRGLFSNWFAEDEYVEPFSPLPMEVARQLRAESQQAARGEPSWSALASLLEEEQFVHTVHYFTDALNATQHSLADDVDRLLPLIKNHPYAAFIDGLRYDFQRDIPQLVKLYGSIKVVDPRMNMFPMLGPLWNVPGPHGQGLGAVAYNNAHRNFTLQGMREYLTSFGRQPGSVNDATTSMLANEVREVAPQADTSIAYAIAFKKEPTAEQVKTWESQLKEDPTALYALGYRYKELGDMEGALRCYQRSLASTPSATAAVRLAEVYLEQGAIDKWEQTLLDYLRTEDLGLEHQSVEVMLSRGYIDRGQWDKALPIAEQCSRSWSAGGLMLASEICEGMAQWESSEQYIRATAEGYPRSSAYRWYFWCRRTGRGDVAAAREMADSYFAAATRQSRAAAMYEGAFHLFNGDAAKGLEAYRAALGFQSSFSCTFMVAQLARASGNEKLRTEVLTAMQKACIEPPGEQEPIDPQLKAVGLAIIQLMKSGDASGERLSRIDELLCATDSQTRSAYAYYVGKELEALGMKAEAEKYWRRALVIPNNDDLGSTLAGFELAKLHGTSRPDGDVLDAEDLWPPLPAANPKE